MKKVLVILMILFICCTPVFSTVASSQDNTTSQESLDGIRESIKNIGKGMMIGTSVFGAALAIGSLTSTALEAMARQPENSTNLMSAQKAGIYACLGLVAGVIFISLTF